jgi:ankyrin repeat protein
MALLEAAYRGNVAEVRRLAALGVDVNAEGLGGVRPLHWAAFKGRVEVIKALVQLGAQIDAQSADGETPLKLCIRVVHHQAAQVRELERTARARKEAATSERAQQAAE